MRKAVAAVAIASAIAIGASALLPWHGGDARAGWIDAIFGEALKNAASTRPGSVAATPAQLQGGAAAARLSGDNAMRFGAVSAAVSEMDAQSAVRAPSAAPMLSRLIDVTGPRPSKAPAWSH